MFYLVTRPALPTVEYRFDLVMMKQQSCSIALAVSSIVLQKQKQPISLPLPPTYAGAADMYYAKALAKVDGEPSTEV